MMLFLNWKTATELNNLGFEIERRNADGENSLWNKISFIPGSGTMTNELKYSYTDKNLNTGSYNYRIKQIDFNGSVTIYNLEMTININSQFDFELLQNYPNPFNPVTKIRYTIPTPPSSSPLVKGRMKVGFVSLKVYDVLGNEVSTLVNEYKPAGSYEVEFNTHSDEGQNLTSGVYIYTLRAGDYFSSRKMIVLK